MAKALYERLFTHLVQQVNKSISPGEAKGAALGVLDI